MPKAMLIIMDGWGIGKDYPGNAILAANTPVMDALTASYPYTTLEASGMAVGLPEGQMGNSEVGHLNIGAGRVIYQDLTRINKEIEEGDFQKNEVLRSAIESAKAKGGKLHLLGLVSNGGVHSHLNHIYALLQMSKDAGLEEVFVHAFLDGRDVPPDIGAKDLKDLQDRMAEIGAGKIATVSGRYYAMDRDKRWERVEIAYDALTLGEGRQATDPVQAVKDQYAEEIYDEFVLPTVITEDGQAIATIDDGDAVIFFNFRPDRARQMTRALVDEGFEGFDRKKKVQVNYVTMTEYDKTIENVTIAYPPETYDNTLGQVMAQKGLKQLRIAETEKYAHVTFFFNGGVEEPNPGEDRILIPSPKVATYDLLPEMSAVEVTDTVLEKIQTEAYDLIILNFANCDMVGHTAVFPAEVKAVETVDASLGRIFPVALDHGYELLITADHGNGEQLLEYESGGPFTAHTTNPVPLVYITNREDVELMEGGKLADLAPTLLDIMDIDQPAEMTGHSLIQGK